MQKVVRPDNDGILVTTEDPYSEFAREIMSDRNVELNGELYR